VKVQSAHFGCIRVIEHMAVAGPAQAVDANLVGELLAFRSGPGFGARMARAEVTACNSGCYFECICFGSPTGLSRRFTLDQRPTRRAQTPRPVSVSGVTSFRSPKEFLTGPRMS